MKLAIQRSVTFTAVVFALLANAAPVTAADRVDDGQWYVDTLRLDDVHAIADGTGVVVAVIDTGVDADHPDLAGSILPGIDLTGDEPGGDGHIDISGHGTAMAGLIVGHGRVTGVAPGAKILPIRVMKLEFGSSYLEDAVSWAVDHGADVINISLTGVDVSLLKAAVDRAVAAGVVIVNSAGNLPDDKSVLFPGAYPNALSVAATDPDGEHAEYSITGPEIDLAAPGTDLSLALQDGGYGVGHGTSGASAIVAGAAALLRQRFPDISATELMHRLTATAVDQGPPGHDLLYGAGALDILAALTADVPPVATPTVKPPQPSTAVADRPASGASAPVLLAVTGGVSTWVVFMAVVWWAIRRRGRTQPSADA